VRGRITYSNDCSGWCATDQKGITTWSVAHQPEQSFEYVMRPRTAGVELDYSFR